jgi:hypothetical protein
LVEVAGRVSPSLFLSYLRDLTMSEFSSLGPLGNLRNSFMMPAFFVHIWLLLLAAGASGVRLLYPIFRAIEWAQWFLKQGHRHPLRAIGMVAAVLVFAGATIGKVLAAVA